MLMKDLPELHTSLRSTSMINIPEESPDLIKNYKRGKVSKAHLHL